MYPLRTDGSYCRYFRHRHCVCPAFVLMSLFLFSLLCFFCFVFFLLLLIVQSVTRVRVGLCERCETRIQGSLTFFFFDHKYILSFLLPFAKARNMGQQKSRRKKDNCRAVLKDFEAGGRLMSSHRQRPYLYSLCKVVISFFP